MLRAVHQHDDRHARIAPWHHQAPGQAHARAVEGGVGDVQRDAPPGHAGETDTAGIAIEAHALAVVAPGPAERTGPCVVRASREFAGGTVPPAPAQVTVVARPPIDVAAVVQPIAADPAVVAARLRSEERRVGTEVFRTCRYRC